jgi:predicted HTH domain antitoxin
VINYRQVDWSAPVKKPVPGPPRRGLAMSLVIPDEVVRATQLSEEELRLELAVLMFREERLTLGQASRFAGLPQAEFQQVLGARRIPVHYGVAELEKDVETHRQRRAG